ncbi:MAG: CCA tRNA nucleotidyltransferase [Tyzzerella sp.]|nr:CCA tRNA nucleotidyltransferase [Tyzzerella sp.]
MKIQLPEKVRQIINTLQEHGYEAYAVGGCVRDSILGRIPDDWDITTSATPLETKALFPRTFDTGIAHGTITVLIDKEAFEVTTYRVDGEYEDSRHPKEVTFTRSLKEDLLRRDFTINAMAYNDAEGLIDIFGGMNDLHNKTIRCVGKAKERFGEDALRILRAVRFAAQLGFKIEEETRKGIRDLAPTLANISAERIQVELIKMMISPNPGLLQTAYELGITKVILPEFDEMMKTEQETPHHMYSVGEHTLKAIENVRADKVLRLTMLFHDIAKPLMKTIDEDGVAHFKIHDVKGVEMTKQILRRLKFDNDTMNKVVKLVQYHDYRMPAEPKNVRKAMNKIGEELFPYYLEVREADTLAQSGYKREEKLQNIYDVRKCYEEIMARQECVSLKTLAVTGTDLIASGMQPGKEIGRVLNKLLEIVIENPEYNKKEYLLKLKDEI